MIASSDQGLHILNVFKYYGSGQTWVVWDQAGGGDLGDGDGHDDDLLAVARG